MRLRTKMEIPDFYAGKSIFLTGATGFMGKVLLEKILRSLDVSVVYVLIRPKKGMKVQDRLEELFKAPILENLAITKPNCKEKVIPIAGDTSLPNYGICENDLQRMFEQISVVFHCAASVKFQEPLLFGRNFNVGPASSNYTLTLSGFSGNATNCLGNQIGQQFSANDVDNDVTEKHCAKRSGWWFKTCFNCNLNAQYRSIYWDDKGGERRNVRLRFTEMKFRPKTSTDLPAA